MSKPKLPPLVPSPGHACYAVRDREDKYAALTAEELRVSPREEVNEFFSNERGDILFRAAVSTSPRKTWTDAVVVATSAWLVAELCGRLKCEVPGATAGRLRELLSVAQGSPSATGRKSVMKSKSSGKSIILSWAGLFEENEARVKAGKQPWTDAELIEKMSAEFPESKGKSTLTRPRMFRSCYNAGTHFYKKHGAGKVTSYMYDADGNKVEAGKRKSAEAAAADNKPPADGKVNMAEHARKKKAAAKGKKKVIKKKAKN